MMILNRIGLLFPCVILLGVASVVIAADGAPQPAEKSVENGTGVANTAELEFFERKIRPVLAQHCYECHSSEMEAPKGNLVVDSRAGLLAGGDSGPALVAGKPEESLLIEALKHESFEMPPDRKLPANVIADFERWIRQGAVDPRTGKAPARKPAELDLEEGRRFWSFQPVVRPALPAVRRTDWVRNEIDQFVLARLESAGLQPAAEASRPVLIRRLSFDLTGLPPTPEEVDAFVNDSSPDAYERLVERLLASERYGERWGRHWLDIARFAESSGGGRELIYHSAWRYRDYVIRSFNADKPYDRFIAEQLAGDLLPWSDPDERADNLTATGFLVLGPTNYETQDKELLRMDVVDEQIDTMGRAFLGMTIGCARCHDHKFDPIPTRDYYALAGIFRSTKTLTPGNVSGYETAPLPIPEEQAAALAAHANTLSAAEAELKQAQDLAAELEDKLVRRQPGRAVAAAADSGGRSAIDTSKLEGIVLDDAAAVLTGDWMKSTYTGRFLGTGYLHDKNAGKGMKSVRFDVKLPRPGLYEVRLGYVASSNRTPRLPVIVRTQTGDQEFIVNQQSTPAVQGVFEPLGKLLLGESTSVIINTAGTTGYVVVDGLQLIPVGESAAAAQEAAPETPPAVVIDEPVDAGDAREIAVLAIEHQQALAEVKRLEQKVAAIKKDAPPPAPIVMAVKDEQETGDYKICIRGNVHQLGADVPRGFLSVATPDLDGAAEIAPGQSGRVELARWVGSPDNPLTARVFVNRAWRHLLGTGLVRTTDNFGVMGEAPSHPELLDWLAAQFVADGWSIKSTIRRIVLSSTYRQSGEASPQAREIDPENRLISYRSRRRVDAETLRDAILMTSGQLELSGGGPTLPPGLRSEIGFKFETRRRSVYVPILRNTLLDLFEVFDFANPNLVVGDRKTSTLPTQALYLMNSPWVLEQAGAAAARLLNVPELDRPARIELAFRWTVGRPPTPTEIALTEGYLQSVEDPQAAWTSVFHALFGCLDFRYID